MPLHCRPVFMFITNALALLPCLQEEFHHHIVDEAGRTNILIGIALTSCAQNITFIGDLNQPHPDTNLQKHHANDLQKTAHDMSRLIDDSQISIWSFAQSDATGAAAACSYVDINKWPIVSFLLLLHFFLFD